MLLCYKWDIVMTVWRRINLVWFQSPAPFRSFSFKNRLFTSPHSHFFRRRKSSDFNTKLSFMYRKNDMNECRDNICNNGSSSCGTRMVVHCNVFVDLCFRERTKQKTWIHCLLSRNWFICEELRTKKSEMGTSLRCHFPKEYTNYNNIVR